jgi:hypothetical protein
VRVRGGVAGYRGHAVLGARVLVSFVDGSPARPVITAFEDFESEAFDAEQVSLVSSDIRLGTSAATDPVVRRSDLQAAINSIQSTFNSHRHAETGATTDAVVPPHVMSVTATGSAVVKVGA